MKAEHIIDLDSANTSKWSDLLANNQMIFVNYHSKVDCPVCERLYAVFARLSSEYADVLFLSVDTNNNQIADQYIRRRKLPFFAAFKQGILLACNNIQNESSMRGMLENLSVYQIKI